MFPLGFVGKRLDGFVRRQNRQIDSSGARLEFHLVHDQVKQIPEVASRGGVSYMCYARQKPVSAAWIRAILISTRSRLQGSLGTEVLGSGSGYFTHVQDSLAVSANGPPWCEIDCARGQGAKYYELQASTSYARWLNSQGFRRGANSTR